MTLTSSDQQLWNVFCAAEHAFYESRMALMQGVQDLASVIGAALDKPYQRGAALRLLEILPEGSIRQYLPRLVDLASVGHSDIQLVRSVLLRIDRNWLVKNIDSNVIALLRGGGAEDFRRIAELYRLLDGGLLEMHLERCASHSDSEVREIASDFRDDPG